MLRSRNTQGVEGALWRVAARAVLLLFLIGAASVLVVLLRGALVRVFLAVILATGMAPLVAAVSAHAPERLGLRWRRGGRVVIVLLLYLGILAALLLLGALLLPLVRADTDALRSSLPTYAEGLRQAAANATGSPNVPSPLSVLMVAVDDLAQNVLGDLSQLLRLVPQASSFVRVAAGVMGGVADFFYVLILALYFTSDAARIRRYLVDLLPADRRPQAERLALRIGDRLGQWVVGQLVLCALIGTLSFVGLTAIGVRYAGLLALVAGLAEAVPTIGPILSAVPAVAVALLQSPQQAGLALALYVLVQQLENNIIVPRVMAQAVSIHPVAVLLALLVGGELLGVMGAVLAVPVAASAAVLLDEWRQPDLHGGSVTPARPPTATPAPVSPVSASGVS